jgi:hypothetical protein
VATDVGNAPARAGVVVIGRPASDAKSSAARGIFEVRLKAVM